MPVSYVVIFLFLVGGRRLCDVRPGVVSAPVATSVVVLRLIAFVDAADGRKHF